MQWLSWLWLPVAFIWLIYFARRANNWVRLEALSIDIIWEWVINITYFFV
jgi:hypothetical protein